MKYEDLSLLPEITLDEKLASDVAKIACALKSLSVYTTGALEDEGTPELLKNTVDDGIEAINRIFIW